MNIQTSWVRSKTWIRFLFVGLWISACTVFAADRAPNIVFILADDLGYGDLGFLGQKQFETPNIDALAAKGMFFSQHYSGSSVCAPSRSSLLTGQHTGHTFIRGNKEVMPEGQYPIPSATVLLPELLKEKGYVTGLFGKWGLGFPGSEGDPLKQGFDEFFGYNCQRMGHHYYPHYLWDGDQKLELEANAGTAKGTYAPQIIHERTLKFIEENRDHPFFCYVATILPHAELAAPEPYMKRYRGQFDEPAPFRGLDDGPELRRGRYQSQSDPRTAYAAMVTLLDEQVGELVTKLEDLGILEDTLIIFTSDNGPHQEGGADPEFFDSNGIFRGLKRDLYEGGIHVPMIAYWPGTIPAGTQSDLVSAFWDYLPTFSELIEVNIPEAVDGISMLPTLTCNGRQNQHGYLYWEFHENGGRIAVRMDNWKGVRNNIRQYPDRLLELYDLSVDPGETCDVSFEHPEIVQEIQRIMQHARTNSPLFNFGDEAFKGD